MTMPKACPGKEDGEVVATIYGIFPAHCQAFALHFRPAGPAGRGTSMCKPNRG